MIRRLFNVAAAISTLLFLGVIVVWAIGHSVYWRYERFAIDDHDQWYVTSGDGAVYIAHYQMVRLTAPPEDIRVDHNFARTHLIRGAMADLSTNSGFSQLIPVRFCKDNGMSGSVQIKNETRTIGLTGKVVVIEDWAPALLFFILPAIQIMRWARSHRGTAQKPTDAADSPDLRN